MINFERPWSLGKAQEWADRHSWLCGFNYLPSTSVNSTAMWQAESVDWETIDRELGWAEEIGFNSCRVFLQYLVWNDDPAGMTARLDQFLAIADRHHLSTLPIFFDDCAFSGKQPFLGTQPAPVPGIHNSGWTPSPGFDLADNRAAWPGLEAYVTGLLTRFGTDSRVVAWDLYNEPGNRLSPDQSLPLLHESFRWARAAAPSQPLTVGVWNPELRELNAVSLVNSDIITFHNYNDTSNLEAEIARLKALGRPVVCTEWLHRRDFCPVQTHLPIFYRERVGCYNWGLVAGATQTYFPWGSTEGAAVPELWFHDLLDSEGRPHQPSEIDTFRQFTALPPPPPSLR